MQIKNRVYKNRRANVRDQIILDEAQQMTIDRDRLNMIKMLKPCFEYLDKYEVTDYQNFSEMFKRVGFKTDNIKNFILDFQLYINSQYQERNISPIDWIALRTVKKANFEEKNIILNRLALEYPNELVFFTQQYISYIFPTFLNAEVFLKEFQDKVEIIHGKDELQDKIEIIQGKEVAEEAEVAEESTKIIVNE